MKQDIEVELAAALEREAGLREELRRIKAAMVLAFDAEHMQALAIVAQCVLRELGRGPPLDDLSLDTPLDEDVASAAVYRLTKD